MTISVVAANALLSGLRAELEGGTVSYYSGPTPIPGGATTLLLARSTVTGVPAPVDGVLSLPDGFESQRFASGTIAWARIENSAGLWLVDVVVGVTGGGAPIELESLTGYAGGFVKLTSSAITVT